MRPCEVHLRVLQGAAAGQAIGTYGGDVVISGIAKSGLRWKLLIGILAPCLAEQVQGFPFDIPDAFGFFGLSGPVESSFSFWILDHEDSASWRDDERRANH